MTIMKIGTRADKTLIGEDENGNLYVGTPRLASYDELTLECANGSVVMKYGDQIIGQGDVVSAVDRSGPLEKQYFQTIVIDANGNESFESREMKKQVIDWSPA